MTQVDNVCMGLEESRWQQAIIRDSTEYRLFWEGGIEEPASMDPRHATKRKTEEREMSEIELDQPAKTLNSHSGRKKRR